MDYKEFTKDVEIAIGRTRKIDIPAYEKDGHYHYYKPEGINEQKAFKIAFDLKGYNTGKAENPEKSKRGKWYMAWCLRCLLSQEGKAHCLNG